MGMNFLGGLGAFTPAYERGIQTNIDRAGAQEDREYARTQRDFQATQQRLVTEQQQRDDAQRTENALVPAAGTLVDGVKPAADGGADANTDPSSVDAQNGNDVGSTIDKPTPAPRMVTRDQELRGYAASAKKAGKIDDAFKMTAEADRIGMARSAQLFGQVKAGAGGKTALQIANEAKEVYNNDPLPGQVTSITDLGGGAARVAFRNSETGATIEKDFTDPNTILQVLEGYYSPATLAQRQKALFDAHVKAEETRASEAAKGHVVGNGGALIMGDGRVIQTTKQFNPNSGKGVAPVEPVVAAQKFLSTALEKGETKFARPEDFTTAMATIPEVMANYRSRSGGQEMPPEVAADIAAKVVAHPELVKPEINASTGGFDNVYRDAQGRPYAINVGLKLDPKTGLPPGMTKDDAKAKVGDMLTALGPVAPAYTAAAFNPAAKVKLIEQGRQGVTKDVLALPGYAAMPEATRKALMTQAFGKADQLIEQRVGLVARFGDAPKPPDTKRGFLPIAQPGGLTPVPENSPQGRYDARQAQARQVASDAQSARDAKASELSKQFSSDQQSMDPVEFVRKYDAQRGSLSSADARTLQALTSRL